MHPLTRSQKLNLSTGFASDHTAARSTGIVTLVKLDFMRKGPLTEDHVSRYTLKMLDFFEAHPNFA